MPATRTTDPRTSHEAELSVTRVTPVQAAILKMLADGPMHDEELVWVYKSLARDGFHPMASESGIRSRRAELVALGHVIDSGERTLTSMGRSTIVWAVA